MDKSTPDFRPFDMKCIFCDNHTSGPKGYGVNHHTFHCKSKDCIACCEECQDDFIAITEEAPCKVTSSP